MRKPPNGADQETNVEVEAGKTNSLEIKFAYGSLRIVTDPPGVRVGTAAGTDLGPTPIELSELTPGALDLVLAKDGYVSVPLSLRVFGNHKECSKLLFLLF